MSELIIRPLDEWASEVAALPDTWGVFAEFEGDAYTCRIFIMAPGDSARRTLDFSTPASRAQAYAVIQELPLVVWEKIDELLRSISIWTRATHPAASA